MVASNTFSAGHMDLIGRLAENLKSREYMFATAESCTGGLIAALCTELPGSSAWYLGGVTAYADAVKEVVLGVPSGVLREHGAVSGPVARQMARGVLAALGASVAISVSGVAGPDGGTPEKPVGTVWIGAALRPVRTGEVICTAREYHFSGNREEVRLAAAAAALGAALECLG